MMTKAELKQLVLQHRHQMISAFNYRCDNTPANCAHILTQHAIRRGYVPERESVRGETLRIWTQRERAPGRAAPNWACKAACELALEAGFVPTSMEDLACVAWLWLDGHPQTTVEAALSSFPKVLDRAALRPYVASILGLGETE